MGIRTELRYEEEDGKIKKESLKVKCIKEKVR